MPETIRAVATANNVPVIDPTARTQAYLIQRGNSTGFYNDSAHTTLAGGPGIDPKSGVQHRCEQLRDTRPGRLVCSRCLGRRHGRGAAQNS